jgi:hypothetical protein
MEMFDKQGMLLIPVPAPTKRIAKETSLLVVNQCFCPAGHNLISDRAVFDGYNGILLKVKKGRKKSWVALNPAYGVKSRISIDIRLIKNDLLEILCPLCNIKLPVYHPCSCGGELITLFLDPTANFSNSILICNRVDCFNAELRFHNELIRYDGVDQLTIG